jgi:hypothetical protein
MRRRVVPRIDARNRDGSKREKIATKWRTVGGCSRFVTGTPEIRSLYREPKIQMKNKLHLLVLAAAAAMVGLSANTASAQGFDPAEFRQRQLENYREQITVKSEEDWKKLEPLVSKVMDAQRDVTRMSGFGFGRGGGGRRGGGDANAQGGGNRSRAGQPNPEREALQKAIDDKVAADELKAAVAKYREARKTKEAALEKAQTELRKELTPRQEAGAVLAGLLK